MTGSSAVTKKRAAAAEQRDPCFAAAAKEAYRIVVLQIQMFSFADDDGAISRIHQPIIPTTFLTIDAIRSKAEPDSEFKLARAAGAARLQEVRRTEHAAVRAVVHAIQKVRDLRGELNVEAPVLRTAAEWPAAHSIGSHRRTTTTRKASRPLLRASTLTLAEANRAADRKVGVERARIFGPHAIL